MTDPTRRTVLHRLGTMCVAGTGLAGIGSAKKRATSPENAHPDDKTLVSVEEFEARTEMRNFFQESPLYNVQKVGSGEILVYLDPEAASEHFGAVDAKSDESISSQLTETREWGQSEKRKEQLRQEVDRAIEESMDQQSEELDTSSQITPQSGHNGDIVEIGQDTSLVSNEYSDSGVNGLWGDKDSTVDLSNDLLHAEVVQAPSYGNAWAWAYIADEFEVQGSSSDWCSVSSTVDYDGYLWSAAGADSEVEITWKLENQSTGQTWENTHLSESHSDWVSTKNFNDTDTSSETVLLDPSDHYRASVRLEVHTNITLNQGASADFGSVQNGNESVDAVDYGFDF